MFQAYVNEYSRLYGQHSISSNVHSLIHIADDLIENNVNSINRISTYKDENCLRSLGMKLPNCNKPLEQISRRLIEIYHLETDSLGNTDTGIDSYLIESDHEHKFSPYVEYELSSNKNFFNNFFIKPDVILTSRKMGDQWFLSHTDDIVKVILCNKS